MRSGVPGMIAELRGQIEKCSGSKAAEKVMIGAERLGLSTSGREAARAL